MEMAVRRILLARGDAYGCAVRGACRGPVRPPLELSHHRQHDAIWCEHGGRDSGVAVGRDVVWLVSALTNRRHPPHYPGGPRRALSYFDGLFPGHFPSSSLDI